MPEWDEYFTSESRPWMAWPISWNRVVTSPWVRRDGLPSVGLVKLQTIAMTGRSILPLNRPWLRYPVIHAPCFFPVRGWKSAKSVPIKFPALSVRSKDFTSLCHVSYFVFSVKVRPKSFEKCSKQPLNTGPSGKYGRKSSDENLKSFCLSFSE